MDALRRFFVAVAMLLAMGATTLVSGTTATAEEAAPPPPPPVTAMASPGCDPGTPPSGFTVFNRYHGGDWWWDACETCDIDAWTLGAAGWATWCWETASPALIAELWLGPWGLAGETAPDPAQLIRVTSPEQLAQLVQAGTTSR
jgi:hypothetical protein